MQKLDAKALGYAAALISAAIMLVLGIFGNLGIYEGAVDMMTQWHAFFSLSIGGIIAGMVESAVISFIVGYLFVLVYNRFVGTR